MPDAQHSLWMIRSFKHTGLRDLFEKGKAKGRWSIMVNGDWRVTFEFRDGDAYALDYEDYH